MPLNEEQEKAKNQISWPLLILAWAWSWKTSTLTARIEHMIKSWISPSSILAVTFTNKAAREMKHRVSKLLWVEYQVSPYKNRWLPMVWTFHSIWVYILKEKIETIGMSRDFVIYDESDKLSVIKSIIKDELGLDEKKYPPRSIASFISNAKNALISAQKYEKYADSHIKEIVNKVYLSYDKKLSENNSLDFDDILVKTLDILQIPENLEYYQEKWKYLMVDEYQDTNAPQYEIVKLLASKYRNLAVVWDDWQCLDENTLVKMQNWTKKIKEIISWDKILSFDWSKEQKYYEVKNIYSKNVEENIYTIKTNLWYEIKATSKHIFFTNPEDNNQNYEYAVYLMYNEKLWYRIWFTRYKWLSLWIRKRLNWERADYAFILETTNDIKYAKYLEQLLSFKYSIPQNVFFAKWKLQELTQEHINNIYKNIDTKTNVEKIFLDYNINKNYPHIIASSTNRFDSLRVNINFLAMVWNEKGRRFWMYRVTLHTSNNQVIKVLQENFPDLCRKSKLWIRIDKELANYEKIWNLTQDIYIILEKFWFNVFISERFSFLKQSYIFTPASNIKPWFWVTVFDEKTGEYKNDFVVGVDVSFKKVKVYDLDINRTHNFVANNIVLHNSIYSWRWADMRNIINFKKDYQEATVIKLEQNYRSTKHIINAANEVIKKNKSSLDKTLFTQNEIWEKIVYIDAPTDRIESSTIVKIIKDKGESYSQNLLLYRTNSQSRALEEALMIAWIPYKVIWWLKFYDRMEIRDMLAYLRVIHNPNDVVWMKRIINVPSRKIWTTTLWKLDEYRNAFWATYLQIFQNIEEIDEINSWAKRAVFSFYEIFIDLMEKSKKMEVSNLIDYIIEKIWYENYLKEDATKEEFEARIDNLKELKNVASNYNWMDPRDSLSLFLEEVSLLTDMDNKDDGSNFVTLMTIHTSKWLEYERVFITWLEEWLFPSSRSMMDTNELEEERRLMYVAMTRAKKELYISRAGERFQYWNYVTNPPSRFISEINQDYIENYAFSESSKFFSNDFWIQSHPEPVFKIKKAIIENDVSIFSIWDRVSHNKFWIWNIISMSWDIAEMKFWINWIKKMNIKIAPIKKI